ncbi:MAG: malate dehydrogenase [Candidatus Omnitrophica bacterium]|nr:malate dehydrogenase [Candidatus Omnitrophota bacterium]
MARARVTVVGAGFVGAATAQRIVEKNLADVVLTDIVEGMPQGKALDIMESAPVEGFDAKISGTNDYKDTAGSDVIVITAGLARKPGMTREDLISKNAAIVSDVVDQVIKYSPQSILVIVSNPLDIMTYLAQKRSGFPQRRVFGMAGVLDSARMAYFIAEELKVKPSEVNAVVLGGHGDLMVPVPRFCTVRGKSITEQIPPARLEAINQRTRDGGAEIVKLLKTGSAYYAPSSSVVKMLEAILNDRKTALPVCAYLNGEYGLKDVYCGVPVILGRSGVIQIVELALNEKEKEALHASVAGVKKSCRELDSLMKQTA